MEQSNVKQSYLNQTDLNNHIWKSTQWLERKSVNDEKRCERCEEEHGKIIAIAQKENYRVASHPYCRCFLERMLAIEAGYATQNGTDGADYWLYYKRKLPDYYITKSQAKELGWRTKKGNLADVAPQKIIMKHSTKYPKGEINGYVHI